MEQQASRARSHSVAIAVGIAIVLVAFGVLVYTRWTETPPRAISKSFTLTEEQRQRQAVLYGKLAETMKIGEWTSVGSDIQAKVESGNTAGHEELFTTLADSFHQQGDIQHYVFFVRDVDAPEGTSVVTLTADRETGRILSIRLGIAEF